MPTTALIDSLTQHPARASLPVPGEGNDLSQILTGSIGGFRILDPVKVCKKRVVDGWKRVLAAKAMGLDEVPVVEVAEEDVFTIILDSLVARQHYTKSALAYVAFPLLDSVLKEVQRRAVQAARSFISGSKHESAQRTPLNTAEEIANSRGIGRTFYFQAAAIRKKFTAHPSLRETWEPKILSGEMGLGAVEQAISGKIAAIEGRAKATDTQMLFALFDNAPDRFAAWERISKQDREEALKKWTGNVLPNLPEEFHDAYEAFLALRPAAFTGA